MGQRIPPEAQPPPEQGQDIQINEIIEGVGLGLSALTEVTAQQAPEISQGFQQLTAMYEDLINQMTGRGAQPEAGMVAEQAGPGAQPMGPQMR